MTNKRNNSIDFIEFPARSAGDLASVKIFFRKAFGWSYREWGNDYADTQDSDIGSGINADPEHRPSQPLAVIYTDNLELTQSKVLAAGGIVTKEVFEFPGGRRFHFKDPAGNELAVWSDRV